MIIQTFNGHDVNDGVIFRATIDESSEFWGLPRQRASLLYRTGRGPLVSEVQKEPSTLAVTIEILDRANAVTHRETLMGYLDIDTPAQLVVTDDDGVTDERYKEGVPERVDSIGDGKFLVVFRVHDDHHWRWITEASASMQVSEVSVVVTNGGDADAYPVFRLTPTTPNAAGFGYKQWKPVRWRVERSQDNYPYELSNGGMDTAALVSGGKAQADGDDFRVYNNGVEIDRWFGPTTNAFNDTDTKIWVGLNFEADVPMTLKTAIAGTGAVDTIEVNEDIGKLPTAGIVVIDSEAFVYTSKSNVDRTLNNVTRASRDSSAGAHSAGADVYWIQHDLFILYGNASTSAPVTDDTRKPIIDLDDSTNVSWVYTSFGAVQRPSRSGSWRFVFGGWCWQYHANHGAYLRTPGTEYTDVGIGMVNGSRWLLFNACGITAASFTNGEKWETVHETDAYWIAEIQSSYDGASWGTEYEIVKPAVLSTWEAWSRNETLDSGSLYVALYGEAVDIFGSAPVTIAPPATVAKIEFSNCTVTLDSSYTPTPAFATSEQGNYQFDCTIANTTTGESISVSFNCEMGETLEIDTLEHTVVYLLDNSNVFSALTVNGTPRIDWLKLQPGDNTITYTDAGGGDVTLDITWRKRWR